VFNLHCADAEQDNLALIPSKNKTAMDKASSIGKVEREFID